MSKKTLQDLIEEKKESTKPADVARLWNKGKDLEFGEHGLGVYEDMKRIFKSLIETWEVNPEGIKAVLIQFKETAAQDFKSIETYGLPEADLASGYIFAIVSRVLPELAMAGEITPENRKVAQIFQRYLAGGDEALESARKRQENLARELDIALTEEESEQLQAQQTIHCTKAHDGYVYGEHVFEGSTADEVTYEERYEPLALSTTDSNAAAGFIGTNFVADFAHENHVLDSYSDVNIYREDCSLRATITAVADGFGHMGDLAQISEAANIVSHEFTKYMSANVAQIEAFIREGDKAGFQAFIKEAVAYVNSRTIGLEETSSLACSMMFNIDGKFYHASVNVGDGVIWKIDHAQEAVTSLLPSRAYGRQLYNAAPPAFHTIWYKQGDKVQKNPLDPDVDVLADFGELSQNDVVFVGSDAQMDAVMSQMAENGDVLTVEGDRGWHRHEFNLTETVGQQLYQQAGLAEGDSALETSQKMAAQAIGHVNQEREKKGVESLGDDHTAIVKNVGAMFRVKKPEALPEGIEAVEVNDVQLMTLTPALKFSGEHDQQTFSEAQAAMQALLDYAKTLPDAKNINSRRDKEGYDKRVAIVELVKTINEQDTAKDAKEVLSDALRSEYKGGRQQNKLLVNRGPFHAYWLHSVFAKNRNDVSRRFSKSTTEDKLIDLYDAVDKLTGYRHTPV